MTQSYKASSVTASPANHGSPLRPRPIYLVSASEPSPDVPWIDRLRSGDEEEFDALFRAFYPRLCGYAARSTRSPEVAEELVQEVFAWVWERRLTMDPKGSLEQYLFRAVRNRALKHLRHRSIRDRFRSEVARRSREICPTPEEQLRYVEISDAAQRAIDDLPDRCRQIFLLSREGALTYGEIAELLQISVKTVETQMGRALKAVRSALNPYLS
jgi:RNA polymerase sigma-70 factor (ECF subfamily)